MMESRIVLSWYGNMYAENTQTSMTVHVLYHLLPTGSEERDVLGVWSIPVAILPSCQDIKTIAL